MRATTGIMTKTAKSPFGDNNKSVNRLGKYLAYLLKYTTNSKKYIVNIEDDGVSIGY